MAPLVVMLRIIKFTRYFRGFSALLFDMSHQGMGKTFCLHNDLIKYVFITKETIVVSKHSDHTSRQGKVFISCVIS